MKKYITIIIPEGLYNRKELSLIALHETLKATSKLPISKEQEKKLKAVFINAFSFKKEFFTNSRDKMILLGSWNKDRSVEESLNRKFSVYIHRVKKVPNGFVREYGIDITCGVSVMTLHRIKIMVKQRGK